MIGHVRLGPVGDIRDYLLQDTRQYIRSNANQMAAKLGTGAGDYSDLQSWTAWSMDSWEAGVGKEDPEAGGFLYSEAETRWPKKLQLPLALVPATQADTVTYPLNTGYTPGVLKPESTLAIGSTQTVRKLAKQITGNGTRLRGVFISLNNGDSTLASPVFSVTVSLWTDTANLPNASLTSVEEYLDFAYGYGNHFIPFDTLLTNAVNYHLVIEATTATEVINLPIDTSSYDATADRVSWYNGSAWASYTSGRPLIEPVMGMPYPAEQINKIMYFPASGYLYAAAGEYLYRQTSDTAVWTSLTSFASDISDLHTDGETLWIGLGDSTNLRTMNSAETITADVVPGRLFTRWNGYLWRAVGNDVYYTGDGTTWTGPIEVCPQGFVINGLAGQQDYMFVACDDALYYIGAADTVYSVTQWGQLNPDENFGEGMVNWQGALYIPVAQGLLRYDASTMLPVGPDLGEGLPLFRAGNIGALATQNNWLFCTVRANAGQSTVWAYNGQGWHFVCLAPTADVHYFTAMHYRRDTQRLYLGTNTGVIYFVVAQDSPNNTDLDTLAYTVPYGWIEFPWFFGGLKDVDKDFESVEILGDNIDAYHPIRVYWQDDGSDGAWEYLGEVTASGQELRWDDYTTRPNTKQIKIALGLYAKLSMLYTGSPVIRAVRVKFHNMVTDTWRWSIPLQVSNRQTMLDGTLNTYTAAQQIAHLDALAKQVAPVIFEDLDGTQYECKVVDASRQVDKLEYIDGALTTSYVYRLSLEQVTAGTYTP